LSTFYSPAFTSWHLDFPALFTSVHQYLQAVALPAFCARGHWDVRIHNALLDMSGRPNCETLYFVELKLKGTEKNNTVV